MKGQEPTTQTKPKQQTPKQPPQHQANNHQVPDQSMKRWNRWNWLTLSLPLRRKYKKPRLSQPLQHLVVNNAQTLPPMGSIPCGQHQCYPRILHSFIQSKSKEELGSLACHYSWAHKYIIQKKQKCLNRYELSRHSGFQEWMGVRPARCTPMQGQVANPNLTKDNATTSKGNSAWRPMLFWLPSQGTVFNLLPLLSSPHRYILLIAGKLRRYDLFFFPHLGITWAFGAIQSIAISKSTAP